MTELAHEPEAHSHPEPYTGIDNRKFAMWAFLSSEFLLFGALIANFLLFKNQTFEAPTPPLLYDIPFTSVSSFVLLMSSLTMVLAHNAWEHDDPGGTRTWLLATAGLGMVFIAGQVFEFTEFFREGLSLSTNPLASSFYVLTGFHGAHVTVGIIMLLTLVGVSRRIGSLPHDRGMNVELVGLYWHFVDIIWIVIFTVVYLIP